MLLAISGALSLSGIGAAEARSFEPQANWWNSGHLCAAARAPPGRRWRALPPRSCVRPQAAELHANYAPSEDPAGAAFGDEFGRKTKWAGFSGEA